MTELKDNVISSGTHAGVDWKVKHNGMGFRCGYARIPRDHPWFGKDYDSIDASVHGGLTYGCMKEDGYWIGFDCAHCMDAQDPSLPADHPMLFLGGMGGEIRTQEYVENECRQLCEQVAASSSQKGDQ